MEYLLTIYNSAFCISQKQYVKQYAKIYAKCFNIFNIVTYSSIVELACNGFVQKEIWAVWPNESRKRKMTADINPLVLFACRSKMKEIFNFFLIKRMYYILFR